MGGKDLSNTTTEKEIPEIPDFRWDQIQQPQKGGFVSRSSERRKLKQREDLATQSEHAPIMRRRASSSNNLTALGNSNSSAEGPDYAWDATAAAPDFCWKNHAKRQQKRRLPANKPRQPQRQRGPPRRTKSDLTDYEPRMPRRALSSDDLTMDSDNDDDNDDDDNDVNDADDDRGSDNSAKDTTTSKESTEDEQEDKTAATVETTNSEDDDLALMAALAHVSMDDIVLNSSTSSDANSDDNDDDNLSEASEIDSDDEFADTSNGSGDSKSDSDSSKDDDNDDDSSDNDSSDSDDDIPTSRKSDSELIGYNWKKRKPIMRCKSDLTLYESKGLRDELEGSSQRRGKRRPKKKKNLSVTFDMEAGSTHSLPELTEEDKGMLFYTRRELREFRDDRERERVEKEREARNATYADNSAGLGSIFGGSAKKKKPPPKPSNKVVDKLHGEREQKKAEKAKKEADIMDALQLAMAQAKMVTGY